MFISDSLAKFPNASASDRKFISGILASKDPTVKEWTYEEQYKRNGVDLSRQQLQESHKDMLNVRISFRLDYPHLSLLPYSAGCIESSWLGQTPISRFGWPWRCRPTSIRLETVQYGCHLWWGKRAKGIQHSPFGNDVGPVLCTFFILFFFVFLFALIIAVLYFLLLPSFSFFVCLRVDSLRPGPSRLCLELVSGIWVSEEWQREVPLRRRETTD